MAHAIRRRCCDDPSSTDAGVVPAATAPQLVRIGRWRIDPVAREVSDEQVTRRLSPRAMQLLQALAAAGGAVVSRGDLMDAVWPDTHVGDESLTQAVTELRRALGDRRGGTRLIETVPKAGYRLTAPVFYDASAEPACPMPTISGPVVPEEETSLDARIAITEARLLAKRRGTLAAPAIEALTAEACAAAPQDAAIHAETGVLMTLSALHAGERMRRMTIASQAVEHAVRLRPDLAATNRALGFVAGAMGRITVSERAFERALAAAPDDFETHYLAAQVFFGCGAHRAAVVLGERAADLAPDDYRPAYNAARAALALGDRERAGWLARRSLARLETWLAGAPHEPRAIAASRAARALIDSIDGQEPEGAEGDGSPFFYDIVAFAHAGALSKAIDRLEALADCGWRYLEWLRADPVHGILNGERRYDRLVGSLASA
ncbi:MAG: transcriptional regulator [Pseudomonadota bacterium]